MESIEESIRSEIRSCGEATAEILSRIEAALADNATCADLLVLRGDAIQLSDGTTYTLEDAERSYLRAMEIEPSSPAPYEALGYFHFAVMDDAATARTFFERAIANGGGDSAHSGLREVLAELEERANLDVV